MQLDLKDRKVQPFNRVELGQPVHCVHIKLLTAKA